MAQAGPGISRLGWAHCESVASKGHDFVDLQGKRARHHIMFQNSPFTRFTPFSRWIPLVANLRFIYATFRERYGPLLPITWMEGSLAPLLPGQALLMK